ncbi:hypothetical protein FG386_000047 [Cryptosporidium ryanae]|uniref:uncharacterized protein n=1 Tax=Cryptosporidium ryanae TaxID=515981 RepID=UPI00351AA0AC|nr:hypothetical protein FG386_000047 [Cryptosporidium ryanae]
MNPTHDELKKTTRAFYVWHEEFLRNSDGSINASPQPQAFVCNVDVTKLSSGKLFSGFVTNQGYLYCWAWNKEVKDRNDLVINPIPVTDIDEYVYDISCGSNHFSCFTEGNSLYVWAFPTLVNDFSEEIINQKRPIIINDWKFTIKSISSGKNHILVLLSDNSLYSVRIFCGSEFQEDAIETKTTLLKGISDKITKITAGTDFSVCLTENNTVYYWKLSKDDMNENFESLIESLNMEPIIRGHICSKISCNTIIKSINIQKNLILLGILFSCEADDSIESNSMDGFTHIYSFNYETAEVTLIKNTVKDKTFKSVHPLYNYICVIYSDDTIFFKNLYIDEEEVMIRTKGEIKLFNVSSKEKCLIMNVIQNLTVSNNAVDDTVLKNEISNESVKSDDVEPENVELNSKTKDLIVRQIGECHIPSNTTFKSSDHESENYQLINDITIPDSDNLANLPENKASYLKPTVSSKMALKETKANLHPFLRKGEGKNGYIKPGIEKMPSNSLVSRRFENIQNNTNIKNTDKNNETKRMNQVKIIELENENKRILKLLEETNRQYYKDMKSLYEQLKEKNDEKFPLKTVVEQLQRELFVEKEEKNKLKDECENVKSKLQIEINTRNIKRDLLNTQFIIERDNLVKENMDIKNKYTDLNNKYKNLEIVLAEISSKYNESIHENDQLKQKYEEIDQIHTETINQLSKAELEMYELRKENETLKIPSRIQNISVNELYEYIDKLENNIKDMKNYCSENHCEKSELIEQESKVKKNNSLQKKYLERYNEEITRIKEFIKEKIQQIKQNDFNITSIQSTDQIADSEIAIHISELINALVQKTNELDLRNKSLEKKVNILEKCIKTRKEDVSIIAENEIIKANR